MSHFGDFRRVSGQGGENPDFHPLPLKNCDIFGNNDFMIIIFLPTERTEVKRPYEYLGHAYITHGKFSGVRWKKFSHFFKINENLKNSGFSQNFPQNP